MATRNNRFPEHLAVRSALVRDSVRTTVESLNRSVRTGDITIVRTAPISGREVAGQMRNARTTTV